MCCSEFGVILYFLPQGPGGSLHFTAKWWVLGQLVKGTHLYVVDKNVLQSLESREIFCEYISFLADYPREEEECIHYTKS